MSSDQSSSSQGHSHNEDDQTYADSGSEPSIPDTTPSKRRQQLHAFPAKARARVDAVTLDNANRCLVTNFLPHHAVDYAHLLPRASKDKVLTQLEFAWGLKYGTLNVDTRFNVFRLRKDVHALFDKGCLILLPEADVINKYLNGGNPDFIGHRTNNVRYKYTLIASEALDGYALGRFQFPVQPDESQEPMNFLYPFTGFPTLESHVHPCFAICHAGRFMEHPNIFSRSIIARSNSTDLFVRLTSVISAYNNWMAAKPNLAFFENGPPPGDDERSEGDQTQMHRLHKYSLRRNVRHNSKNHRQGSPSEGRGSKTRQRSDNQRDCHDDTGYLKKRSLRALEAGLSPQHAYKRKRKSVQDWVSSIVGQTFVEDNGIMSQKNRTCDDKGEDALKGVNYTLRDISVN